MPDIHVNYTTAAPYRFVPNRKALIFLKWGARVPQNFCGLSWKAASSASLRIEDGLEIKSFDVSPDGKQIVFDRVQQQFRHCLDGLASMSK